MDKGDLWLWKRHLLKTDEKKTFGCGSLSIFVDKRELDWYLASFNHGDESLTLEEREAARPELESVQWTRWPMHARQKSLFFRPVMQDRPVMVRPETPVGLMPGSEVKFYVAVPANLAIETDVGERITVLTTVRLSDTWFGTTVYGEHCYALHTLLRRRLESVEEAIHMVVCPVLIRNESSDPLIIHRFCLRVPLLSIYESQGRLWSNQVKVINQGKDENAVVDFQRSAPSEIPEASLLTKAAIEPARNLIARTFNI